MRRVMERCGAAFGGRESIGRARGGVHGSRRFLAPVAALCALVCLAACATPDAPPFLADELPPAALEILEPDTLRTVHLARGVVYHYAWTNAGPWAVHLVQADLRARCELELGVLRAEAREAGGAGRERVSSMVAREDRSVIAAVNADFFTPEGSTVGPELTRGWVAAASTRPAIAWKSGRAPWIGKPSVDGDSIRVGWSVSRADGDGVTEAVGGFPELLDDGRRVGDLEVASRASFAAARHPRTAVGWDPEQGRAWIVVVDGRQTPYSDGMTLPELTQLFEALGTTEAVNLDGGGSTVMVVGEQTVNRPSDFTGERPVVNALALLQSPRGCLSRSR